MKNFKAGTWIRQRGYKSFQPEPINRQWVVDDMEVLHLLSQADRHLGRLDMYSEYIPSIELFIRMHANTAPITEAPVMSPRLRDRLSRPETTPRRSGWTSIMTAVLLAAWKS